MKIVEIDFTGCKSLYELHERIRVALDFPEWYGRNWDAFWDLLAGSIDIEKIVIKGEKSLHSGFKKHLDIMHNILDGNIEFRSKSRFKPFSYEILS